MEDKESRLKGIRPLALLRAITPEAKNAIVNKSLAEGTIDIWHFPFRIGRKSRIKEVDGLLVEEKQNNDFDLVDHGKFLHISKEHFQIEKNGNSYFIQDRYSTCGTIVNDIVLSKKTQYFIHELNDGDIITIGTRGSPYKFQFTAF